MLAVFFPVCRCQFLLGPAAVVEDPLDQAQMETSRLAGSAVRGTLQRVFPFKGVRAPNACPIDCPPSSTIQPHFRRFTTIEDEIDTPDGVDEEWGILHKLLILGGKYGGAGRDRTGA